MHRWDRRRPAEALHYFHQLRVRTSRMTTFAVIKDDEVTKLDHATLEQKRLLSFPVRKSKAKAKANVVEFKLRNRNKKRVNE